MILIFYKMWSLADATTYIMLINRVHAEHGAATGRRYDMATRREASRRALQGDAAWLDCLRKIDTDRLRYVDAQVTSEMRAAGHRMADSGGLNAGPSNWRPGDNLGGPQAKGGKDKGKGGRNAGKTPGKGGQGNPGPAGGPNKKKRPAQQGGKGGPNAKAKPAEAPAAPAIKNE